MPNLSEKLCDALEAIRLELKNEMVLDKLKKIIELQIQEIKQLKNIELILDETSSRIKSIISFKEKIARKNYLKDWGLNDDSSLEDCKEVIREKLSDLIGIRVNCFFKDEEESIYKYFIEKLETFSRDSQNNPEAETPHFTLPTNYKDDVTELKTKDKLYKVSCKYEYKNSSGTTQSCFFELQIKCMIHNLWGEVEHEVSYKAPQYDYAFQSKNKQLRDIYSSLKSSDSQLKTLYTSQTYKEQDLMNSLFFLYTQSDVKQDLNGKNPSQLYTWFFQFFMEDGSLVTDYVKNHLVPSYTFSKTAFEADRNENISRYFVNEVLQTKFVGKFNDLTAIAKRLYENVNEENICWLITSEIIKHIKKENEAEAAVDPNVLREIAAQDDDDDDLFASETSSPYSPILYLKNSQQEINNKIEQQSNSFLSREDKNALLRCVEFLCFVISGGILA